MTHTQIVVLRTDGSEDRWGSWSTKHYLSGKEPPWTGDDEATVVISKEDLDLAYRVEPNGALAIYAYTPTGETIWSHHAPAAWMQVRHWNARGIRYPVLGDSATGDTT